MTYLRVLWLADARADEALREIRELTEVARVAIDLQLGFSKAFVNRSRGQRMRWRKHMEEGKV